MSLLQATKKILFSKNDYFLIDRGIEALYKTLSESSGIYAGDLTFEKGIYTSNGWVVSPVHAAHCVKDQARTTQFLRGIYKAINYHLTGGRQVHILYAGCGPYATLLTPFTSMFTSDEINFTLLDINEVSLKAVEKFYHQKDLLTYVDSFIHADATDPEIHFNSRFDIIISETMQAGLKREHQVPLTRNLVRFLTPQGIFIPERIVLDVYLTGTLDPQKPHEQKKELLGTAYELDFRKVLPPNNRTVIEMAPSQLNYLQLFTEIFIYGNERLTARQSGLTLPLTLDRFADRRPKSIQFTYQEGTSPELLFEYVF